MDQQRTPVASEVETRAARVFAQMLSSAGLVMKVAVLLTALLVVPFLALAPTESASTEPSGAVFTARDRIDDTFVSSVYPTFFVAEHESRDLLRAQPLADLLAAEQELRQDPALGPTLFSYFESDVEMDVVGVLTLADLVDHELRLSGLGGLSEATDSQVKAAGADLIERFGERSELLGLSAASSINESGEWVVPALRFLVLSDDTVLGFGNTSVNLGGGTESEEYSREVQGFLRLAPGLQVNGVAIDVNLTAQEQGEVAGPFIGFTVLAVLMLVGLTFRSYWVIAVVSVALAFLMIWLKGLSNLIGLEEDLVLSLIVPIAMVSFGVDFAFHAIGRYREERAEGRPAGPAYIAGMAAVSGALVLALTSDVAAFLSNATAGIESIIQFGIGAGIALVAAFLLLGVVAPLAVASIEANVPPPSADRRSTALRIAGSFGAASLSMASVLFLVFVLPAVGVVLAGLTAVFALAVPFSVQRRKLVGPAVGDVAVAGAEAGLARPIGRVISALANRRAIVLPIALAISGAAAVLAVQVPAEFDVEDFFASDTDFVVGLNQLDEHVGDLGGEPAVIYVEGDLTDPSALAVIANRLDEVRGLDTDALARDGDGVAIQGGIFSVFDAAWTSGPMLGIVEQQTGVVLTDTNGDQIPDTAEQVEALIATAGQIGVPFDTSRLILTPDDVNTVVVLDGSQSATTFALGLVNSRAQESVASAKDALEPITRAMSNDLGGSFVQVTGSPFVREASLEATNRALQVSLPIALVLCLVVASAFLRSIRYGIASLIPILMVVSWLYAFMEMAGYAINLVTATIAAVSIGIGIDFAIHFISRYREELERHGLRLTAVRVAGEGTGLALVASAVSSAVGFGILALAPMPLFAAYGLLTALMIMMALVATLTVLPSVLVMLTSDDPRTVSLGATASADHANGSPPW